MIHEDVLRREVIVWDMVHTTTMHAFGFARTAIRLPGLCRTLAQVQNDSHHTP